MKLVTWLERHRDWLWVTPWVSWGIALDLEDSPAGILMLAVTGWGISLQIKARRAEQ